MKYGGDLNSIMVEMEGTENLYLTQFEEILLNPMIVDISKIEIKKEGINVDFTAPIIFDENDTNSTSSMMKGVNVNERDEFYA